MGLSGPIILPMQRKPFFRLTFAGRHRRRIGQGGPSLFSGSVRPAAVSAAALSAVLLSGRVARVARVARRPRGLKAQAGWNDDKWCFFAFWTNIASRVEAIALRSLFARFILN